MKKALATLLLFVISLSAHGKMITTEYSYKLDTTTFKGFLAYDDAVTGKRPGVLVVHEWWGLNDFAREQAKKVAALGYIALAVDMYGNGRNTTDPREAASLAGALRGTPAMRARMAAGLNALIGIEHVDPSRIAAIGFCFGGTAVLGLAYGGADVRGVVTFHGGLFSPKKEDLAGIKAKFLFLHGAEDPTVSPDTIRHMEEELTKASADWQTVLFSNTVHSFTNPSSGSNKSKGVAYNPLSAQRAWKNMELFLKELFSPS